MATRRGGWSASLGIMQASICTLCHHQAVRGLASLTMHSQVLSNCQVPQTQELWRPTATVRRCWFRRNRQRIQRSCLQQLLPLIRGVATAAVNLQLVSCRLVGLRTESLALLDKYYDKIRSFCQDDSSALRTELVAFLTACHEGLLQKFALPGIPDWMAFMNAVCLMLRVIGVFADEPLSFPLSREFASAFAPCCLLCVGIRGELGQNMVAAFVSDHVDQLRSACSHLRDAQGDVKGMSSAASFCSNFWSLSSMWQWRRRETYFMWKGVTIYSPVSFG